MADENLLVIDGLRDVLKLKNGEAAYPVDGVSFTVPRSKTVGLVGESGCGKSMTARTVMRILDKGISVAEGHITFDGEDLLALPEPQMRDIRGNRIAMIFQEPMTALNPSISVGKQVREAILLHEKVSRAEAKERVIQMFREVGIPEADRRYKSYPHQLSGGLRQRICIAMGMICNPDLLIADEPTTALDVTVEAQILELMKRLQRESGMSILIITHNLGVVADICDEVNVMYAGQIVEHATKAEIFNRPLHPYTIGLMDAIPRVNGDMEHDLHTIPGTVPALGNFPEGCRFCTRCPFADERCRTQAPALEDAGDGHLVRCFKPQEVR
ncbi:MULTISPECIES: ABC transporter ATP-binding protein [Enorma]|uniref:ABC transporter ATP-binding protein n=1 Tax=Enorma TaxID=1472762 RepID=UPI000349C776|nr:MULTISPECIES: ABC transporter ATP-binding protein [Enorma]